MLEDRLEQDIKAALLSGDKFRVTTLRGLKATLLNIKVALGKRDSGLSDEEVEQAFSKESKKRQESADLYKQGGNSERAEAELKEKSIIGEYLPEQVSEEELTKSIDEVINGLGAVEPKDMGRVIAQIKSKYGTTADGSVIARLVKERLNQ
jgi:uncharacterized protein YqeY